MSSEEEKRCPLCAEEMDWTDLQFKPCRCDYQVCVWCWHQIMDMAEKDATEGRCPACRTPYDKEKIAAMQASCESKVATINSNPKQKPPKAKSKTNEEKKDLTNVRVIQRKMAYVIGLPLSLADEDLLLRKEYFGQYGRVTKISLSRTAGGSIQQFVNDTCSVYITYLKEEEAIRCIQSVHGFVLEGRFLRASFGTAKYCHAWLRNMPCNNPACLYLHSNGAEEDSFGKDEVAAVHTRNRVHQMVGATHNSQQRSGNVLPPPVDEPYSNSGTSTEEPTITSELKGAFYASAATSDHLTSSLTSEDTDEGVRATNRMTTFVDIVGRPQSSGPEKDGNVAEERRILKLSSELSPVIIDTDNHMEAEHSDAILCRVSSSSHIVTGLPKNKESEEPIWEPSNLLVLGRNNLIGDASVQVQYDPYSVVREDVLSFDNQILKDSDGSTQTACLFPSSYPSKLSEDSSGHAWRHKESSCLRDFDTDHNIVHNHVDESSIQFTRVNSILNDGYNERKFQNSAKSDRIYRGSNSFSNEEIVEHLRRLEDDNTTNDDEISTFDAVESSIISNLMSMDLDDGDDSLTLPHSVAGLFDETDRQHASSWNFHNSDQSGLSFAKQEGFTSQVTDMDSFSNIYQVSKKSSVLHDSGENKEHYFCKPQYYVPRTQSLTPPGFSASSRDPPPGFSACERTEQVMRSTSGSHLAKTSLPNNHYRAPSTGNIICNTGDDFSDPAILVVGRGKPTSGLSNSGMDMRPAYTSKSSTFEDESRLWLLMQKSTSAHHDPKFSQIYRQQQTPSSHQELRYSGHIGDGFSHLDDIYGISSRLKDQQHQTYNPSSFMQLSQQKIANGHISTCYQPGLNEAQRRNEVVMAELHRNERLRFNDFSPGYGDSMFQMSSPGDVYTRVFGM